MKEALENGFRRKEKGGALDGGPEGWQRRRRAQGEDSDDDDLGIDVPDRAWEAVELSSDDDGEWAERAARRKAAAAAAEAPSAAAHDSLSARGVGFDSQDFRIMIDAGKKGTPRAHAPRRGRRGRRAGPRERDSRSGSVHRRGASRANSANVAGAGAATGPGLERHCVDVVPRPRERFALRRGRLRRRPGALGVARRRRREPLVRVRRLRGLAEHVGQGRGGALGRGAAGDDCARLAATKTRAADFGWAPRERMAAPASKPKGSRLGNGGLAEPVRHARGVPGLGRGAGEGRLARAGGEGGEERQAARGAEMRRARRGRSASKRFERRKGWRRRGDAREIRKGLRARARRRAVLRFTLYVLQLRVSPLPRLALRVSPLS